MHRKILGSYQRGEDYLEFSRLDDDSYVVRHFVGDLLANRHTTTGYDDAMIHYRLKIKALKNRTP